MKIIWGEKWTKNFSDVTLEVALYDWADGVRGIPVEVIERALHYCKMNLEWPPSIAEFIFICELEEGMPSCDQTYDALLRKEFLKVSSHPVVKMVYDKIGSWALANDGEKDLRKKVRSAYDAMVIELRMKRNKDV
jgi:hypothetical protein